MKAGRQAGGCLRTGLLLLLVLEAVLCSPVSALCMDIRPGDRVPASVIRVYDGDTVEVLLADGSKETVRLAGVDTPETHHPSKRVEELGIEAAGFARRLLDQRSVLLEFDAQTVDRYGRLLAYVWLEDRSGNRFMSNRTLVMEGYAVPYTFPPNVRYEKTFRLAFREAKTNNRGLWALGDGRLFTAEQVWNELPYICGSFITLLVDIEKCSRSDKRWTLSDDKSRVSVIVYLADAHAFGDMNRFRGKRLKVTGKIVSGYRGAELVLSDPCQILGILPQ